MAIYGDSKVVPKYIIKKLDGLEIGCLDHISACCETGVVDRARCPLCHPIENFIIHQSTREEKNELLEILDKY